MIWDACAVKSFNYASVSKIDFLSGYYTDMNTGYLQAETLSMIARLAPRPEIFRSTQLANCAFHMDHAQQHHVRVGFRTLVTSVCVVHMDLSPMSIRHQCSFTYKLPNGHTDGRVLRLDIADRISYVYMVNGIRHGADACWSIMSDDINLLYLTTNKFGTPHGAFTQWYPSGEIWVRAHNIGGYTHGEYTVWNIDGTLKERHKYDMGRLIAS